MYARPDTFTARVDYAARVISKRRETSRAFDGCFENYDGDEVVAALILRARRNERIAANLPRYICAESIATVGQAFAAMTSRQIAEQAASKRMAMEGSNA